MVVPRQCVHLHLTASHPVGEVLEDSATTNGPVKVELRETEGWVGWEGEGEGEEEGQDGDKEGEGRGEKQRESMGVNVTRRDK